MSIEHMCESHQRLLAQLRNLRGIMVRLEAYS